MEIHRPLKIDWGTIIVAACVVAVFVGRFFFPSRELDWTESYVHFAHIVIGMLFVLSWQGCRKATAAWVGLTVLEVVMFMVFKHG